MPILLRRPTVSDIPPLNLLIWAAKASWGYPEEWLQQWWPDLAVDERVLASGHAVVAEDHTGIHGFYLLLPHEPEWVLDHLWVSPACQGRGLGRRLLTDAGRVAAEAGRRGLAIDSDPNAEVFYLRCGAERRGVVPAPMPGEPTRCRPQLWFPVGQMASARESG